MATQGHIPISSNFDRRSGLALDPSLIRDDWADVLSIPEYQRYPNMIVSLLNTTTQYQLVLGTVDMDPMNNANWVELFTSMNPADYYTAAQLNAGQLDNRYYTETEIGTILDFYYLQTELQGDGTAAVHWNNLTSVPGSFPPSAHTHSWVSLDQTPSSLSGQATKLIRVNVGESAIEFTDNLLHTQNTDYQIYYESITPIDPPPQSASGTVQLLKYTHDVVANSTLVDVDINIAGLPTQIDELILDIIENPSDTAIIGSMSGSLLTTYVNRTTGHIPTVGVNTITLNTPLNLVAGNTYLFLFYDSAGTFAAKTSWQAYFSSGDHPVAQAYSAINDGSGNLRTYDAFVNDAYVVLNVGVTSSKIECIDEAVEITADLILLNANLQLESDGTLSSLVANYETLVTANNDIPNRKYITDTYYTQIQLQTSGQSAVHWNNLTNVPALGIQADEVYRLYQPDGTNPFVYTDNGGNLHIDGPIIQSGLNYEIHTEQVYQALDLIITRDGAVAGLGAGEYTGIQASLYDGVNDGQLVFDNIGVARVGDVGSLQPIATREESPTDQYFAKWVSANNRFETVALSALNYWTQVGSDIYYNTGNVGIGTTTPLYQTSIYNTNLAELALGGNTASARTAVIRKDYNSPYNFDIIGAAHPTVDVGNIRFFTSDQTSGEKMIITTTGYVGIGITTPDNKLTVYDYDGSPPSGSDTKDGSFSIIGHYRTLAFGTESVTPYSTWIQARHTDSANPTSFYDIALNPLGGNVGIGTTSPDYALTVQSESVSGYVMNLRNSTGNEGIRFYLDGGTGTNDKGGLIILGDPSSGTWVSKVAIEARDGLPSYFNNGGNVGIGTNTPSEALDFGDVNSGRINNVDILRGCTQTSRLVLTSYSSVDTVNSSTMSFYTANGTTSGVRLYIDEDGDVGIGTNAPTEKLDVRGNIRGYNIYTYAANSTSVRVGAMFSYYNATSAAEYAAFGNTQSEVYLKIYSDGHAVINDELTADDFLLSSDRRLKTEIDYELNGISVDGLKPTGFLLNGKFKYGFIAQDMLKTHPELVNGTGKEKENGEIDYYSIKENSVLPIAVKEIQQLKKDKVSLEKRVEVLEDALYTLLNK